ncbi:hypothetical protein BDD12DRAFT_884280 [Trichophaea hybrida]|nr:hypothetical protein BDD12DRAFT_884280 [Trichophaea hybrida]
MPRINGKKKAPASTSAPAPLTKFTPRVYTPAWVLERIKRDTEEEEARIAAKHSHPEPTVSPSSSSLDKKPATVSPRRLPFEDGFQSREAIMSDMDGYNYQVHEMQMIKDDVESTLKKLQNDILSQLAVQASDSGKYYDEFFARVATLETKDVTLERLREAQMADAKNLRQWVDDLEGKNRKLETVVKKLLVDGKKAEEERKLAVVTQVVTPPTTPQKEITIRPAPPKTLLRVATSLAQQVLKRNLAKRK